MKKIHPLLFQNAEAQIQELTDLVNASQERLREAIAQGDLSENSEYDAAKESHRKCLNRLEDAQEVLQYEPLDVVVPDVICEGCVLHIQVWGQTEQEVGEDYFSKVKQGKPVLEGNVTFGGSLDHHTLYDNGALSIKSIVGEYILRSPQGGDFSIKVRDRYTNVTATRVDGLKLNDIGLEVFL